MGDSRRKGRSLTRGGSLVDPLCSRSAYAGPDRSLQLGMVLLRRGQFELNCSEVQATVLSQKIIEGFRFEGSEYTIGVRGCGRQAIYVTYCGEMQNCNALSQTGRIQAAPEFAPPGPGYPPPGQGYSPPGPGYAPQEGMPPPGAMPPPRMAP